MIKKKLKTILTLIICLLFIYSCAGQERFETMLNQLVMRDINEVIASWGPPTNEYTLPNGFKMYSWVRGGYFYDIPVYCEIHLTTDYLGKIVRWTYRGNACY